MEVGGRIVPVEIRLSATPKPAMAAGILALSQALAEKVEPAYLIHPGEARLALAPGVLALPFAQG